MSEIRARTDAAAGPLGEPSPGPLIIPGHRLEPAPGADRRLRRWTILIGALTVALIVLGLAAVSATTWLVGRGFSPTPVVEPLGRPSSLVLSSSIGDVRVLPSGDVDEVTLALVEPGSSSLPDPQGLVPARLSLTTAAGATSVEVAQPARSFGAPWSDPTRDVLVLVPTDLELSLELRADVADVLVDGDYTALDVHSDAGALRLGPLSAPGGVSASTDIGDIELELGSPAPTAVEITTGVGDVDLQLPTDAVGPVEIRSETGDIEIAVPGTSHWRVQATSELGDVRTARGISGSDDVVGTLAATTGMGEVRITR